jgi:hypothetical protein
MEARVGFEPTSDGFADHSLRPLGYRAVPENSTTYSYYSIPYVRLAAKFAATFGPSLPGTRVSEGRDTASAARRSAPRDRWTECFMVVCASCAASIRNSLVMQHGRVPVTKKMPSDVGRPTLFAADWSVSSAFSA